MSLQGYRYITRAIEHFDGAHVTFVVTETEGIFIPVRHLCEAMGVSSQTQIDRIKDDSRFASALAELPVQTAGGKQRMQCLKREQAALWILTIDPKRCRGVVQGKIEEFQQAVMYEADRIIFGDYTNVRAVATIPPRIEMGFHLVCLRCHTPHVLAWDGSQPTWEIER